jgi:hypothetical protein
VVILNLPALLQTAALQISTSRIKRHLFLFALALLSIVLISYHYGTFDQSVHIPFLKAAADPTLYPNDPFVALRSEHYSYFWLLFIPFYNLGILEEAMLVTHILITYFTFWTVYELSWTLFKNPLSSMFATVAFLFPHISFCGFPFIEWSLLNRTFVMPFLIMCINLYLRGIRARSFFMLGILYNLHVVSVNFVLAMFALDMVLEYRKIGWRKILNCAVVFILAALPVLLWKLRDSGAEIELQPGWLDLISRTMMLHVFYLVGNNYVWVASLSALSSYGLLYVAYRNRRKSAMDHTVLIFVLGATLMVLVEEIVATWLPVSIILQMQIVRAGIFAVFFAYLYFADYLARQWQYEDCLRPGDGIVTTLFFASPLIFITVGALATQRWWSKTRWGIAGTALGLGAVFSVLLFGAYQAKVWHPGIYIYGVNNAWRGAQEWAKANTTKDAVFITPLNKWWVDEAEWRVFSERQNVTSLSEILEASFEPEYMAYWQERFETLAPGALAQFHGDFVKNRVIAGDIYNSLSTPALLNAACKYQAGYIVVEKAHPHELREVYENAEYIIYDVRQAACQPAD